MTDFPDYQEPAAAAAAIGATNLVGTGLAREAGGNLDTHTNLLRGTATGALVANAGLTVAQETAALIASGSATGTAGGAPLLHGVRSVLTVTSQVIAASGSFSTSAITLTRPGYVIRVLAQMSAVGSNLPSVKCDLVWRVGGSSGPVTAEEIWYIPAGGSAQKRTNGRGPTKGDTLIITFTNGDAANSVTITVNMFETTQHMARDDWRSDGGVASAGSPAIADLMASNILGNDSFTVAASTTVVRNLPLYAGQGNIWINQNAGAGSQIQVVAGGAFSPALGNPLANLDWTLAPHQLVGVIFPRAWCQLVIINQAAAQVTFSVGIAVVEFAS